jgi:Zn-dependent protease with chaperone function
MPSTRCNRIALLVMSALLALARPAAAQKVTQSALNGYGLMLRRFANAAERAGRTDWYGPPYEHPGTAVLVTFDAHNTDISLVTPHEFGMQRLLSLSQTLAARTGYPNADYNLYNGNHTISVDIELNKYLHRERFRTTSSLDLSRLGAELNALPLPGPVVIAVEARSSSSTVITTPTSRTDVSDYWFAAPSELAPGTTVAFKAEVTPAGVLALTVPAVLLLVPILMIKLGLRRARTMIENAGQSPPDPSAVQKRYDRGLPRWVYSVVIAAFALIPSVFARSTGRNLRVAFELLLPAGPLMVALPVLLLTAFYTFITWKRTAQQRTATERTPAQEDATAAMRRLAPLLLLFLIPPLLLALQLSIPIYTQTGLLYRRNLSFVALGLMPVAFVVVLYKISRGTRTLLTEGPWFDMVHDIAAHAGVTVRRVFMTKGRLPNAYATAFNSVGMTSGLTELMEPDEVRAVLAHEIGHLKYRHPQRTLVAALIANFCFFGLWTLLEHYTAGHNAAYAKIVSDSFVFYMVALNFFVALVTGAGRRRREREADEFAVEFTNDPDLVIRALTKIHDLGLQPHRLRRSDEALQAHPSLDARIEAIRRR